MNKENMLNVFRFMFEAKDRQENAPISLETVKPALEEMGVCQDYLTDDECLCILAALAQYKEMKQEKAEKLLEEVIDTINSSDSGLTGALQAMNQKLMGLQQHLKELEAFLKLKRDARDLLDELTDDISNPDL